MTRILRIINRFNIGGPTYNATFLTRFMDEEFETLLVGGMPEEGEAGSLHIPQAYGVQPHLLPEMKRKPDFRSDRKAYRRICELIEEFKPEIVHTHASKAGALGRRAAARSGVPVIVHTFHGHVFHSYFNKLTTLAFKNIERRLARSTTGIIAISDIQKSELCAEHRICPADKVTVIPLGFDLERFYTNREAKRKQTRDAYGIAENEVAVAIIGRLVPVKNHDLFLDALKHVFPNTDFPLRIFIVGDGTERPRLEEKAARELAAYQDRIHFTSWIHDIATFNAGMDLVCLASHNEGTPVSLIEAQASGIPVISTDVGGVRNVVNAGKSGLIVPGNKPEEYAKAMLTLINDPEKRKFMSQNGRIFVEDKFHYTRLVSEMKTYYRKLLAEHART